MSIRVGNKTRSSLVTIAKHKALIHVTVLHWHAVSEIDGDDSQGIVTKHLFVISPDLNHDNHSVHHCLELVAEYLKEIKYNCKVMHK